MVLPGEGEREENKLVLGENEKRRKQIANKSFDFFPVHLPKVLFSRGSCVLVLVATAVR